MGSRPSGCPPDSVLVVQRPPGARGPSRMRPHGLTLAPTATCARPPHKRLAAGMLPGAGRSRRHWLWISSADRPESESKTPYTFAIGPKSAR
jgi:hypothetical protein